MDKKNKIIGITFSCFDLLHAGHVQMLEDAQLQCDYLIVALQTDPTIDRKDKNAPTQSLVERYIQLKGCRYVDEIVPYETEEDLITILKTFNLNIRIVGEEYRDKEFTGKDICKDRNIQIYYNSRQHNLSSSELKRRIKDIPSKPKNLVFTSAGGNTNFDEFWLEKERDYDVWVIFYGDDEDKFNYYKERVEFIEKRKGDKWQNFHYVYHQYSKELSQYERFFLLDDDIIITTPDINKMFSISKESTLWICQPSFAKGSRLGHLINIHDPHYYLRYTNFVENNTPLMTRKAIDNFFTLYSPDELDPHGTDFTYIWANGVEEKQRYAVIDSIQCVNPVDRVINGERVRDCLNLNSLCMCSFCACMFCSWSCALPRGFFQ